MAWAASFSGIFCQMRRKKVGSRVRRRHKLFATGLGSIQTTVKLTTDEDLSAREVGV
jgi:hypothetical protein